MHRKGSSFGDDFSFNNRSPRSVRPTFQPFTRRNETLCVVLLFGDAGASIHDSQSE